MSHSELNIDCVLFMKEKAKDTCKQRTIDDFSDNLVEGINRRYPSGHTNFTKNNIKLISKPVKTEFCRLALDRKRALSQQMFNKVFLNLIISFCIVRRPI